MLLTINLNKYIIDALCRQLRGSLQLKFIKAINVGLQVLLFAQRASSLANNSHECLIDEIRENGKNHM